MADRPADNTLEAARLAGFLAWVEKDGPGWAEWILTRKDARILLASRGNAEPPDRIIPGAPGFTPRGVIRGSAEPTEDTLAQLTALVNEQAEDEALWALYPMGVQPITEAYLQQELRRLHESVERLLASRGVSAENKETNDG